MLTDFQVKMIKEDLLYSISLVREPTMLIKFIGMDIELIDGFEESNRKYDAALKNTTANEQTYI